MFEVEMLPLLVLSGFTAVFSFNMMLWYTLELEGYIDVQINKYSQGIERI